MSVTVINGTINQTKLIISIYEKVSKLIALPDNIEVYFKKMNPSSYGETVLDFRRTKNKIFINSELDIKSLFYLTIHELVHVSQIYTGKLAISRTGVFVWENKTYPVDPLKMSYREYQKLPWEVDAHEQQMILGKKLLENQ